MKKNLLGISLITMSCLYGILAAVIILVFFLTDIPIIYGIVISIIILLLQFLISPFLTDLSMKWFYGVKFDYDVPDYLKQFIDSICTKYHMKYPRIGFIDDGAPNAFTYGRTKNDARIILTRGLFNLLSEDEVKAVVGHELGHATHYDMFFMTVAQLVPLVLYGVYVTFTDSDDSDNSKLALVGFIAYILYVISQYIILWLSRTREYYADSFAIEETGNPNALAEALVKIGYGLSTNSSSPSVSENGKKRHSAADSNALGIFDSKTSKSLVVSSYQNGMVSKDNVKNAMKWETWNIWAIFYELHSTHPLISKRLLAISNRCGEFHQEPYIVFDLEKTESYVDDFLVELVIKYLPFFTLIVTLLISIFFDDYFVSIISFGGILMMIFSLIKFSHIYKNTNYHETNVYSLLSEVKVSGITSIPCTLSGKIIGRGNPGCIFNEDFVIEDNTGIMFLDYNQPVHIVNKLFALFKSQEYFDKIVKVKGWYRRSPVPYVEIYTMEIDGQVKKIYTYILSKALRYSLLIIFIVVFVLSFF